MRHWVTHELSGWSDGQVFTALVFAATSCYFIIDITVRKAWRNVIGRRTNETRGRRGGRVQYP